MISAMHPIDPQPHDTHCVKTYGKDKYCVIDMRTDTIIPRWHGPEYLCHGPWLTSSLEEAIEVCDQFNRAQRRLKKETSDSQKLAYIKLAAQRCKNRQNRSLVNPISTFTMCKECGTLVKGGCTQHDPN